MKGSAAAGELTEAQAAIKSLGGRNARILCVEAAPSAGEVTLIEIIATR
jgi:hypothetical protein